MVGYPRGHVAFSNVQLRHSKALRFAQSGASRRTRRRAARPRLSVTTPPSRLAHGGHTHAHTHTHTPLAARSPNPAADAAARLLRRARAHEPEAARKHPTRPPRGGRRGSPAPAPALSRTQAARHGARAPAPRPAQPGRRSPAGAPRLTGSRPLAPVSSRPSSMPITPHIAPPPPAAAPRRPPGASFALKLLAAGGGRAGGRGGRSFAVKSPARLALHPPCSAFPVWTLSSLLPAAFRPVRPRAPRRVCRRAAQACRLPRPSESSSPA